MRAPAEINEISLLIKRYRALNVVDQLSLVRLTLGHEALAGFIALDLSALPRSALLDLTVDLGLESREVVVTDRLGEVEVVVEAALDRRTDSDLRARVEPLDSLREEVGGRVSQDVQRIDVISIAGCQNLNVRPVFKRFTHVA